MKANGQSATALNTTWPTKRSQVTSATGTRFVDDEIFAGGIERGEAERGERHQPDRLQADGCVGVAVGSAGGASWRRVSASIFAKTPSAAKVARGTPTARREGGDRG